MDTGLRPENQQSVGCGVSIRTSEKVDGTINGVHRPPQVLRAVNPIARIGTAPLKSDEHICEIDGNDTDDLVLANQEHLIPPHIEPLAKKSRAEDCYEQHTCRSRSFASRQGSTQT